MTLYEFLLTVHVLSVILWIGGGSLLHILFIRFRAARDFTTTMHLGEQAEKLGKTYFMPLSILTLASGVFLVLEGDWGFEHLWILLGLAGIVVSSVIGAAFIGPSAGKIARLAAEKGLEDPAVQAESDRIMLLSRIDLVILILVVLNMVVKPTI